MSNINSPPIYCHSQVIKGWDQGLLGMKLGMPCRIAIRDAFSIHLHSRLLTRFCRRPPSLSCLAGEERQVVIPGHEGYGAQGFPAWGIPPNGTLDFTLEVLKIS